MSVDYYLYSPSRKRGVVVGSAGLGGTQSYPNAPEVVEFVRWAIDELLIDVRLVTEDAVDAEYEEIA